MNFKKNKGFTMVELMVVIAIMSFMVVMLSWQILGSRAEKKAKIKSSDLYNAKKAMMFMTEEFRKMSDIQSIGEQNIEYYIDNKDGFREKFNLVFAEGKLKKIDEEFNEKLISELDKFNLTVTGKKGKMLNIIINAGQVNFSTDLLIRKNI